MTDETKKLTKEIRQTLINKLMDLRGKEKSLQRDLFNNNNNTLFIKINLHLLSEQIETIKKILINNKL